MRQGAQWNATRLLLLASMLGALPWANAACADPGAPSCAAYVPEVAVDLTTPAVALQRDLAPIFQRSCGFTTCHGGTLGGGEGLYLGADGHRVFLGAVGMPSIELPAMAYVTAGDPSRSFLLHKIDGDACTLHMQCAGEDCGASMPRGQDLMALADRDKIRRWIAQGAQDN